MDKIYLNQFKECVENDRPFPWTITREHDNPDFIGKSGLELSYIRYGLTMEAVKRYFHDGFSVLDVGVYPGIIPKIFKEFFPGKKLYSYYGCGMGFDTQFKQAMGDYDVTLLEADLDPRLNLQGVRSDRIDLQNESIDMVLCTDVIEHFFDPMHMLKEINRVAKMGGVLILTTDNVSQYGYILALLNGRSNYPAILASNLFFNGDWRPHFREYSKEELFQLLKYAGFEALEHRYYESEFSQYKVVNNKLVKLKKNTTIIGWVKQLVKSLLTGEWMIRLFKVAPSFRDNHFIVARKAVSYAETIKNVPKITGTIEEWVEQRKKYQAK